MNYPYIKENQKLTAIDLSQRQSLKVVLKYNFKENLESDGKTTTFFIIKKVKKTILDSSQATAEVLEMSSANLFQQQYRMTQYNTLNMHLSNLQPNKLKLARKNATENITCLTL